jgi:division protein 1
MMFDTRHIVSAAGEDVAKIYDKSDGRHWDCGKDDVDEFGVKRNASVVERVRIKDGYMIEGRKDGNVGVWTC